MLQGKAEYLPLLKIDEADMRASHRVCHSTGKTAVAENPRCILKRFCCCSVWFTYRHWQWRHLMRWNLNQAFRCTFLFDRAMY